MVKENKMKQTEIGLIPEDWEVVRIEEIAEVDCENLSSSTNADLRMKYISLECINDGSLIKFEELNFKNAPSRARRVLRKGDILISTVRPNLKSHYLFDRNESDFVCSTGFSVLRTTKSSKYIYHHFFGDQINRQIENLIVGSNYPAINNKNVKEILIPLPPLDEQEAIATALSDCDAWIDSIEQVLAKKRLIKQGAMQELLTPKEDWEVKKLGEILQFGNGRDYKHLNSGNIPVYGTGGVMTYVNHYLYNGDSVGIGRKGTIDKPVYLRNKFWTVDTLFYTHSFQGVFPKYIYYQFLQIPWKEYNEASGIPSLNKNTLEQIEIKLPAPYEQIRITTILSDMDLEIEALTQKLNKARQIKQGMMQELLTGRVRLV